MDLNSTGTGAGILEGRIRYTGTGNSFRDYDSGTGQTGAGIFHIESGITGTGIERKTGIPAGF